MNWFVGFIGAILLALLVLAIAAIVQEEQQCKNRGGQMVHDGTFTYIWQITDFKTGAGVLIQHPNKVCSVQEKKQ